MTSLTIGELAARSGVAEGTLRVWEARHSFPAPARLPSGHRRYSERDLEAVLAVSSGRAAGLSLAAAIDRARRLVSEPSTSLYGALRETYEQLHPIGLSKAALLRLTRAIEDECCARAPEPLLFGCFQREAAYRESEHRWRDLARTAQGAFVLAEFPRMRRPRAAPVEVPIRPRDPLVREWAVVCDAPQRAACLVAWERPRVLHAPRVFETVWTIEPLVVRAAARICADLVGLSAPDLVADLRPRLADRPAPVDVGAQLRAAVEVAGRVVLYADPASAAASAVPPTTRIGRAQPVGAG